MSKKKQTLYALRSVLHFASGYKWRFILSAFVFLVSNILLAVIPLFIGQLVGALSDSPIRREDAVMYTWILIACSSLHDVTWRAAELLHMKLINTLAYTYELQLFESVMKKPYPYFVDKFTGKVSSYITTITSETKEFFTVILYNYIGGIVGLISTLLILTSVNWQTGLIFALGIIGMFIVGRRTITQSGRYEKLAADVNSTKNAKIIDAIANFVNVKSFHKEDTELAIVSTAQEHTVTATDKAYIWAIVFWGSMSFFIRHVIWPLTLGLNVYLFLQGDVTLAQLATVLSTILIFTNVVWDTVWYVSQFNLRFARMEEAHTYLFGETTNVTWKQNNTNLAPTFNNALEITKLSFAYPDKPDVPVLHNITLSIKKGEKIGIVGRSGSGKSTLTKLLLNYYDLPEARIRLDGTVITMDDISRLVSYVPQDTSLFHRSIAENIAYANDGKPSDADIVAAAHKANAADFIENITDGYDALVGERGVKLSAGQRQRIAIARAFLDDKPLLILDEATSALDSESEILVQDALEKLWDDKTVLAIAHRLSTLRHMDRIIVLDRGTIIEQGSHAELLKRKGAYAQLWAHQSGGFIEE